MELTTIRELFKNREAYILRRYPDYSQWDFRTCRTEYLEVGQ